MIKIAICMPLPPAWEHFGARARKFVSEVLASSTKLNAAEVQLILTVSHANLEIEQFHQLAKEKKELIVEAMPEAKEAYYYLRAFEVALERGADLILEIDPIGTMSAEAIPDFLEEGVDLLNVDANLMVAILSTRFAKGGKNTYPWYRVAVSKLGTVLTKLVLNLGKEGRKLSDLTAGFEAFSAPLLREMLALVPAKNWVSSYWGPLHLFQSETRAFVCWIAQHHKVTILEKGIEFGTNFGKKPRATKPKYLLKAFVGLLLLINEQWMVRTSLRQ